MRYKLKESDIQRIVNKVIISEDLGVPENEKIRSTKPLTLSEYHKKLAELIYTCKKNSQTCSSKVSMFLNELPPQDKQSIETEMTKIK